MRETFAQLSCCLLLTLPSAVTSAQDSPIHLLAKAGVGAGLVVHVGTTDGQLEAELAASGKFLIHGVALDDAARDKARRAITARGAYGLAAVASWVDRRRLPYASGIATVVIADTDKLGDAVSRRELGRVVSPGGVIVVKTGARWTAARKVRPPAIDHWMHFDHGPDGNPVSRDIVVEPVRQQQWLSGVQPNPFSGNPAGYAPGGGIRLWGRYAVIDVNDGYVAARRGERDAWSLQCRDAFNGVPLWTLPRDRFVSRKRWSLVCGYDEAYAWLSRDRELTALDLDTGHVLRAYTGTAPGEEGLRDETFFLRVTETQLIVGMRDRIHGFDRMSTKPRWTVREEGKLLVGGVVDEPRGRLYCLVVGPGARKEFGGRWPQSPNTEALLAIDLQSGKTLWRCEEIASCDLGGEKPTRRAPGQIVPGDEHVILFGSAAIGGGKRPFIASIDADTGAVVHQSDEPFRRDYNVAAYNMLWRDGAAWFAGAFTNVWRFDPASGEVERVLSSPWNQRCTRFTATSKYLIFGQTAYYDRNLAGEQVCVARSGCALGSIPANGMTYFTPTACGCITQVRGFQAMTGEPAPPPVPDERRLTRGDGSPIALEVDESTEPLSGPIAEEWTKQGRAGDLETEPVREEHAEIVAMVHRHRVEARRQGKVLWRFVADARVSAPPVVLGDAVVFGAHDGYVYAVHRERGSLLWKYLLAPTERYVCVNGQLESSWPVYGVCASGGDDSAVIASAGTHVELSGGVTVAALDPKTGNPKWIKRLAKPPSKVPPGGKGARIVGHSFLNSVPRIEDGEIVLGDGGRKGGSFAFAPDEADDALNARLATPPKKK